MPAMKLGQGNIFRTKCQEFCPQGGCAWWGHEWQGAWQGGCAWQGGVHGRGACLGGGMHGRGVCMAHMLPPPQILRDTVNAGGTHHTGMHSCLYSKNIRTMRLDACSISDKEKGTEISLSKKRTKW